MIEWLVCLFGRHTWKYKTPRSRTCLHCRRSEYKLVTTVKQQSWQDVSYRPAKWWRDW